MASHHIASGVEVDATYDWSPTESHIFLPAAAALLLTPSSMTSLEPQRCVLYFISHQLNTVNVPHWAFNWDKCDFFTALYHPSSVPLFSLFFFYFEIFIYLFGLPDALTFRDHYRVLHWMTGWPEETQRWGGKKCINRKTPPASTGQRSQGRTFSALLTFLPVKAKCWGAADIFFLPSVAAAFILFIFLPPTPQLPVYYFRP